MRKSWGNIQSSYTAGFIMLAILSAGVTLSVMFIIYRAQMRHQVNQRFLAVATQAVKQINGDMLASLNDPEQEGSEAYLRVKHSLRSILNSNDEIAVIQSLRISDGKIFTVVDANPTSQHDTHYLEEYKELPSASKNLILNLTSVKVNERYEEKPWGMSMFVYTPIFTSDGILDGILEIGFRVDSSLAQERAVLMMVLGLFVVIIGIAAFIGWQLDSQFNQRIELLIQGIREITQGNLDYSFVESGPDVIKSLKTAINGMVNTLKQNSLSLEQRVGLRTVELENRSRYLENAAKVSLRIATILEPEQLLRQTAEAIREQFGLYYTGIYLVDPANQWVILRAGTGKAGQILLARGHQVEVGDGMVGWVVANAKSRVSLEVGQDALKLSTPELPLTRSEAVIPLSARNRVIGAISIQSDRSGSFDRLLLDIMQILADQVAVAIDNARLFSEARESVNSLQSSLQQYSAEAWTNFISKQPVIGYRATDQTLIPLQRSSITARQVVFSTTTEPLVSGNELQLPVKVRGRLLGLLQAHKSPDDRKTAATWSEQEVRLMQDLLEQLIVALDNARLYSIAQRSAERERVLADVTSRVRSSTNVDTILQTAVRQLAEALHVPKGSIVLRPNDSDQGELPGEEQVG